MVEAGVEMVDFAALVKRTAEESYASLKELVDKSKSSVLSSDSDKKIMILKYIVKTQQRFLRLNVLSKWCQQVPLIQYCQQLSSTLSSHDTCFTQAADSMFFMHEGLQQARAPIYDVPSAIEVLLSGTYQRLPKCIEDVGMQNTLTEDEQGPALKKLDTLVRSKLLEMSLPKELSRVDVSNGVALLCVDGEFKVLVTLGYRGHLSMWRILHLELLVGERSGRLKLEESRRHALGDDLERRMAASDTPFITLYSILHELCLALIMDTIIRQVQVLRQGRWKDAIRFDLISDGIGQGVTATSVHGAQDGETDTALLRTPGLKVVYWVDLDRNIGTPEVVASTFLKIEPGPDMQLKCLHSTFVIDPVTGYEADFTLDCSCIDVESLLLRAIRCNKYTRLLEIYKELDNSGEINRTSGDVKLHFCLDHYNADDQEKNQNDQEVLHVRAYGSSFFSLAINIRNGRFLLFSPKNIVLPKVLTEYEEALNQGTITAAKAFINLRKNSILHLFACIGRFLGLEVIEHGSTTVKLPKEILDDSESLLMGFPEGGGSYFLLMQLDREFKPCPKLIEAKLKSSGKAELFSDITKIFRVKNLDLAQMHTPGDELGLSLLDLPMAESVSGDVNVADVSEHALSYNRGLGGSAENFSAIVDEVFDLVKASSEESTTSNFDLSNARPYGLFSMNSHGAKPSTSDQDLASLGSLTSVNTNSQGINEENLGVSEHSTVRLPFPGLKYTESKSLVHSGVSGASTYLGSDNNIASTYSPVHDACMPKSSNIEGSSPHDRILLKRSVSDMLKSLSSLPCLEIDEPSSKRRKPGDAMLNPAQSLISHYRPNITEDLGFTDLIDDVNKGNGSPGIYVSVLLRIIRHSSLCIKHARLTSQMEALHIPYVEEVGLRSASCCLWFRLPFLMDNSWNCMCLRLGRPGNLYWDVKIIDSHYRDLWELQKGSSNTPWGSGVRIANTSDVDSHIRYDLEGVVLSYNTVEDDSISKMVADLQRLSNARCFALGMRKLLTPRTDGKFHDNNTVTDEKFLYGPKTGFEGAASFSEQMRRAFRIEAVGPMSLWFSFISGIVARFVVEWESGKVGCRMHVSPDQLWPHTKFLEDFINGGEVVSLLDCIQLTAGPLHALAAATRPARAAPVSALPSIAMSIPSSLKQGGLVPSQGLPSNSKAPSSQVSPNIGSSSVLPTGLLPVGTQNTGSVSGAAAAAAGRSGPGIVPSSLLPIDVSVVLRGPYWVRIIYRRNFAVDMRCFAGDQVWLQPATPPNVGPSTGGSLPCPHFRPFIMEHVAQELNGLDSNFLGAQQALGFSNSSSPVASSSPQLSAIAGNRQVTSTATFSRTGNAVAGMKRTGNVLSTPSGSPGLNPLRRSPVSAFPSHVRGELNTAIIGLGDDGGYGGGWVPLVALKKVLRVILKYLGVLWLFAQLPDLLNEILGSKLKYNEGALLNLDQEQPALRFHVGGYVFAVSVHRVQLLLQVLSLKKFHPQYQPNTTTAHEELTQPEIGEICDYFSCRVASEPYDASRVVSFITLLTLPISVLKEFLKLIAWKKGLPQGQGTDASPAQKSRIELCLENHRGATEDGITENQSSSKSNIHYDRAHSTVDFALTIVLDSAHIPHINAAGGAAWLPYCVSVRLRYLFGENPNVSLLGMEGSHGGRACWLRPDDWDLCKQRVARTVEASAAPAPGGDAAAATAVQGRLRAVADNVQRTLQACLQGLREAA